MLQINSMPDHIHILVGISPHQSISSLIQNVKTESSKWIKAQNFCKYPFAWQEGYGAFSYGKKPGARCNQVHSKSGNTSSEKKFYGGIPEVFNCL